jgi:hypothetical protein
LAILFKMNKAVQSVYSESHRSQFYPLVELPALQAEAIQTLLIYVHMHFGSLIYGNLGLQALSETLHVWFGEGNRSWQKVLELQRTKHSGVQVSLNEFDTVLNEGLAFLDAELAVHLAKRKVVAEPLEEVSLGLAGFNAAFLYPDVMMAQKELYAILQKDPFLAMAWRVEAYALGPQIAGSASRLSNKETDGNARSLAALCLLLLPLGAAAKNILGVKVPCELNQLSKKLQMEKVTTAIPLFLRKEIESLLANQAETIDVNESLGLLLNQAQVVGLVYLWQEKKWGLTQQGLSVLRPYRRMLEEVAT